MSIILQNGCWAMSDFKKEMDDKLASSSQHQQDIIIIIIIKKMWTLQTLFLSLKIAIFWRIAPSCSFLTEYKMKAPENNLDPANAVSFFENRHFLSHRPLRMKSQNLRLWNNCVPCKRCFRMWKSPFSITSSPYVWSLKIPCAELFHINGKPNSMFFIQNQHFSPNRPPIFGEICVPVYPISLFENRHFH